MELEGQVISGLGRGADYVEMDEYQERFSEALGFAPFPGTLNLVVDRAAKEAAKEMVEERTIEPFEVDGERYSAVEAYPVTVEGVRAALLEMEITDHPPEVAEIVAPVKLRDELGLDDGDTLTCRI